MASEAVVFEINRLKQMGLSYRRIADYLNRKNISPPRAETWSAMTVRNIWVRSNTERSSQ